MPDALLLTDVVFCLHLHILLILLDERIEFSYIYIMNINILRYVSFFSKKIFVMLLAFFHYNIFKICGIFVRHFFFWCYTYSNPFESILYMANQWQVMSGAVQLATTALNHSKVLLCTHWQHFSLNIRFPKTWHFFRYFVVFFHLLFLFWDHQRR